jgi:hypothetical protein
MLPAPKVTFSSINDAFSFLLPSTSQHADFTLVCVGSEAHGRSPRAPRSRVGRRWRRHRTGLSDRQRHARYGARSCFPDETRSDPTHPLRLLPALCWSHEPWSAALT